MPALQVTSAFTEAVDGSEATSGTELHIGQRFRIKTSDGDYVWVCESGTRIIGADEASSIFSASSRGSSGIRCLAAWINAGGS